MAAIQVRITSPRWDGARWQQVGELHMIEADELAFYEHHVEVVCPPAPHPDSPIPSDAVSPLSPEIDEDKPEPPNKMWRGKIRRK